MYIEVSEDSWDLYLNWLSKRLGLNLEYSKQKDGEIDVIDVCFLADEIGFITVEQIDDKDVMNYMIQIENQYFRTYCNQ